MFNLLWKKKFPSIYKRRFNRKVERYLRDYKDYYSSDLWNRIGETLGKGNELAGLSDLLKLQTDSVKRRFITILLYFAKINSYIEEDVSLSGKKGIPFGIWVASYFVFWKTFWDNFATLLSVSYFVEPGSFVPKNDYERPRLYDISLFYRDKVRRTTDSKRLLRKLEELGIEEEGTTFYKCKEYRDRVVHKYLDPLVFCGFDAGGFYPAPPFLHGWSDEAKEDLKMKINGVDKWKGVSLVREFVDMSDIIELVNASFEQVCETLDYFASK